MSMGLGYQHLDQNRNVWTPEILLSTLWAACGSDLKNTRYMHRGALTASILGILWKNFAQTRYRTAEMLRSPPHSWRICCNYYICKQCAKNTTFPIARRGPRHGITLCINTAVQYINTMHLGDWSLVELHYDVIYAWLSDRPFGFQGHGQSCKQTQRMMPTKRCAKDDGGDNTILL